MTADRSSSRTARARIRRFESSRDADAHDLEYWQQIPVADRVLSVWRLSLEQWQLSGHTHEPGLCRSIASVRRG
jgi:hypothetical protein